MDNNEVEILKARIALLEAEKRQMELNLQIHSVALEISCHKAHLEILKIGQKHATSLQ